MCEAEVLTVIFLFTEVGEEIARPSEVRTEGTNQLCNELAAQECDLPTFPNRSGGSIVKQFTVKQEEPDEGDDSACCLDSIKVEDFSPECMTAVQSKVLEEWKPEMLDIQCQDSNASLSCTRLAEGKTENIMNAWDQYRMSSATDEWDALFRLVKYCVN